MASDDRAMTGRNKGRMAAGGLAILAMAMGLLAVQTGRPSALELVVDGPETVLFDQRRDGCDPHHHPDAPARAFRDADGRMILFAPNFHNRAFVGGDLSALEKDCESRFMAAGKPQPNLLDDRTWLHGFYTEDGRTVFALASASFMPYRHEMSCEAGPARTDCWLNGIVALRSTDGGRNFSYLGEPPRHAVFPPEPYNDARKDPPGFITATNIIDWNDHIYSIVWRRGGNWKQSRNCLARAPKDDPTQWSLWTGEGFTPAARLTSAGWQVESTECARVGPRGMSAIRGVVRHEPSGTFIAVYQHRRRDKQGRELHGFFYSTSPDLVDWSMPKQLLDIELQPDVRPDQPFASYPSIIDDDSPDRNFATMDDTANLIFVRVLRRREGGKVHADRQLISLPIAVARRSGS